MTYFVRDSAQGLDCPIIGNATLVASPSSGFTNALSMDGVNRGYTYSPGVDCGTTTVYCVAGVGSAASFCLEAKVKTGASMASTMTVAGRYSSGTGGGSQPLLYISAAGPHLVCALRDNGGTVRSVTGTTTLTANTAYDLAVSYDGTTLRLFVNGAVDGTLALSGIEGADSTTRFLIGRTDDPTASPAPYPFLGTIDEVRMSNTARYTSSYTPSTTPFSVDGNTLGLWHFDSTVGYAGNRGPSYYVNNTQVDGAPSGGSPCLDLRAGQVALAQGLSTGTLTGATGVSAAATVFQITGTLSSNTLTGTSVPNDSQANGKGWQIPPTSGMAASASVPRVLPAGGFIVWNCRGTQANVLAGTLIIQARFYKRTSTGTLTLFASASSTITASVVSAAWTGQASTGSLASDVVFNTGDTMFAEVYITVPGQLATAATTNFIMDAAWSVNTPTGIDYRPAQSAIATGVGTPLPTKVPGKKISVTGTGASVLGPRSVSKFLSWVGAGGTSFTRQVGRSISVIGSGSASIVRQVGVRKLATGVGTSMDIEKVILLPKVAIGTGVVAVTTQATRFKAFFVTGTGSASFARAVTVARSFATAGSGAVSVVLGIPQVALNRLASGSVVKKILYLFDDN